MLSHQIEKVKRVLNRITQPTNESLILENQQLIMKKLIELHSMIETIKNKNGE